MAIEISEWPLLGATCPTWIHRRPFNWTRHANALFTSPFIYAQIHLTVLYCVYWHRHTLTHTKHFPGKQTPYIDFSMIVVIRLSPTLSFSFFLVTSFIFYVKISFDTHSCDKLIELNRIGCLLLIFRFNFFSSFQLNDKAFTFYNFAR